MNRVGLKDYLLNHADDNDLLDCAKAWDAAADRQGRGTLFGVRDGWRVLSTGDRLRGDGVRLPKGRRERVHP